MHRNSYIDEPLTWGGCLGSIVVIGATIFLIGYLPTANLSRLKHGNGPVLKFSTNNLGVLVKVPNQHNGYNRGISVNGKEVRTNELLSFNGFRGSTYYLFQIQYPERVYLRSTYNYSFTVSKAEQYHGYLGSSPSGNTKYYRGKTSGGFFKHSYEFNYLTKEEYYSNEEVLLHFKKLEKRIITEPLPDKISNRFRNKYKPKILKKSLESIVQLAILRRSNEDLQRLSSVYSDPWLYYIHGEDRFEEEINILGQVLDLLVK